MHWQPAPDITIRIKFLVDNLGFSKFDLKRIYCFRSTGSTGRATARIWSLPTIWQIALNIPAGYCLEVISEKFDRLTQSDQEKVLIHELLHVPQGFTGGLVPHRTQKRRLFRHYHDRVETLFNSLLRKSYSS
jgi:predicted metallopeptidase